MTDAIDKAVREAAQGLAVFCADHGESVTLLRQTLEDKLWPLVDAVLEEAAKANCIGCHKGAVLRGNFHDASPGGVITYGCTAIGIRSLKSEAQK